MYWVSREETIMFAKIDQSDGFWRMLVRELDKWNFANVLPGAAGELIILHALQMGWVESPGYFCAATETGRNIMHALNDGGTCLPPHAFDYVPRRSCPQPEFSRGGQTMADIGRLCRRLHPRCRRKP